MSSSPSAASDGSGPSEYQVDDLIVDIGRRSVSRDGTEIPFPALSFDLLLALIRAAPNMLSYDELMARVWHNVVVNPETITQRVKLVRDALGDDPHAPRYIAGVRGRGYRMQAAVMPIVIPQPAIRNPGGPLKHAPFRAHRRFAAIAATLTVVAVAGMSWFEWQESHRSRSVEVAAPTGLEQIRTIAVLPFEDRSKDGSEEYFADGMAEELRVVLGKVPQLRVIAHKSSSSFRNDDEDVREIGERLGVANVVKGSVHKSENSLRISVQLYDAHSRAQLWSDSYRRDFGDVLVMQAEMASGIARALQLTVGADVDRDSRPLRNSQAYIFFLRGRTVIDRGEDETEAKVDFEQALALDPTFIRAQEALALALMEQVISASLPPREGWPAAVGAAQRTLKLDPESALAHAILGRERATNAYDWKGANEELDRALALRPRDPYALYVSASLAFDLGRHEEERQLSDLALAIDPLNPDSHQSAAYHRYFMGDLDGAEREFRASLQISPRFGSSRMMIGVINLLRGDATAALQDMQAEPSDTREVGLAFVYHALGRKAEAAAALERIKKERWGRAAGVATVYAYRNELTPAFEWFEKAIDNRETNLISKIVYSPMLGSLRADSRYEMLLRKMNLQPGTGPAVGARRCPPQERAPSSCGSTVTMTDN